MLESDKLSELIWESAKEAFETMVLLPIEKDGDAVSDMAEDLLLCGISFVGQAQGSLYLQVNLDTAAKITRSMLMMEQDAEVTVGDMSDAIGEVTNLIIGGFKSRISDVVTDFNISVPSVVQGKMLSAAAGPKSKRLEMPVLIEQEVAKVILVHSEI